MIECGQPGHSGVDTLVSSCQCHAYVRTSTWTIKITRCDKNTELRQTVHGVAGRFAESCPQVQPGFGVVDGKSSAFKCRFEFGASCGIAGALDGFLCVVVKRGDHRCLDGSGHHESVVPADFKKFGDECGVTCDEPGAVGRQVGGFGEGVDGQQPGDVSVVYVGVEDGEGFTFPAQADVAFVGGDDGATLVRPVNNFTQVPRMPLTSGYFLRTSLAVW